jgi:hypothetical protein
MTHRKRFVHRSAHLIHESTPDMHLPGEVTTPEIKRTRRTHVGGVSLLDQVNGTAHTGNDMPWIGYC